MKEATGELSTTVVVIIALILIVTFITWFWPKTVQPWIEKQWGDMTKTADQAKKPA